MVVWFVAVAVVLVLGAAAVVAAGAAGSLKPADTPAAWSPPARDLVASDLRAVRFSSAVRGYRADEVDALLDRLAREWEARSESDSRA